MEYVKMLDGNIIAINDVVDFSYIKQTYADNIEEVLESGCVWVANNESDEPVIAVFEIIERNRNPLKSIVKVTEFIKSIDNYNV